MRLLFQTLALPMKESLVWANSATSIQLEYASIQMMYSGLCRSFGSNTVKATLNRSTSDYPSMRGQPDCPVVALISDETINNYSNRSIAQLTRNGSPNN